jgi:pimeloyl-ACP methyl ester carboxylesterase
VGDPSKVDRLPADICEMENEWPVNLERHFRLHFGKSVQKLEIPEEAIARVSAPVLTIHGTRDRNAPYGAGREWSYLLPDARLLTVEGAAHQSFTEAPEIVLPAIEAFLDGGWPPGSEEVTADPREPAGAH